jgi:hypothetical protein
MTLNFISKQEEDWNHKGEHCCHVGTAKKTRQERENHHSPSSSTEVKNDGAIPPLSIRLHGVVLNELNTGTTLSFSFLAYFPYFEK